MKAWIHPAFFWHTLGPLVPIEHRLNAAAYLSIAADHVHPFMSTVHHLLMAASSRIMHGNGAGTGGWHHRCAADTSAAQTSLRNVSDTLLKVRHEGLRPF